MAGTIDHLLGKLTHLSVDNSSIHPDYREELAQYLLSVEGNFRSPLERAAYLSWYAKRAQDALKSAVRRGVVNKETTHDLRLVMRMMDEDYGLITAMPIIEVPVNDCVVSNGKIVRPSLMLPDSQKIPLYKK